jgi:hypothetical protein
MMFFPRWPLFQPSSPDRGSPHGQGSVKVAVCTKCPSIAYHGNLAPALDRRGRVALAHDVGPSDEWDESRL